MQKTAEIFRLHIGGTQVKAGWKILNVQPGKGVDFVGDIRDLSQFGDESCDEIYASHVLEHVAVARILPTLQGFHRILKPGGRAMISVPDLEVLCQLFNSPELDKKERFQVMRMIFGGQIDATDFHQSGFSFDYLDDFLSAAGFSSVEQVESFGLFNDGSVYAPYGRRISLNVIACK